MTSTDAPRTSSAHSEPGIVSQVVLHVAVVVDAIDQASKVRGRWLA